ncbi:MAG: tripartite tricarboxylate transporter TctB family protein, partial [Deltaproteobacteria bacterium]|nr:tripartite tricarboxylate transporter TctB family protein [Deltaproteobacteria bacterium]
MKKVDLSISGVLFIASIYLYYVADCIPTSAQFKDVGAGIWPKIILTCMILACIVLFFTTLREKEGKVTKSSSDEVLRLLMPVSLCAAYVITMKWLGFLVSSMIFSISYMYLVGYRKKILIFSISLAVP